MPDQKGREWLLEKADEAAGVKAILANVPAGIELVQRAAGNSSWLFVLNHSAEKVTIPLQQNGSDLLTGADVNGSVELEPAGVAIIHWKE